MESAPDDAGELVRDVGIANHVWSVEEIVGLLDFMKWEKPILFAGFLSWVVLITLFVSVMFWLGYNNGSMPKSWGDPERSTTGDGRSL
jgi:hypothetical protein